MAEGPAPGAMAIDGSVCNRPGDGGDGSDGDDSDSDGPLVLSFFKGTAILSFYFYFYFLFLLLLLFFFLSISALLARGNIRVSQSS